MIITFAIYILIVTLPSIFIHRPMDGIRGFTYQTLIEVTAAIESAHQRHLLNPILGPEHPRASATDDLEALFAVSRRMLGMHFTLRDFKFGFRRIVRYL